MNHPTYEDVITARENIAPYLLRTPFREYPALSEIIGARIFVKHENHQPTCAFKVRGGINLVSQLSEDERVAGVAAASTGNHGQSVAFAAQLFDVKARIVVPEGANPGKVEAMRSQGAEVIFHGERFDDARLYCEELARREGLRYVHSGNEPLLIAGVGTATVEMLEDQPDLEVIIVPVGGGSGAAAAGLVARSLNPDIKVVAVQSAQADAAYQSWKQRKLLERRNTTIAEGLATGTAFELPQEMMWEYLSDFVVVSDEQILTAMAWVIEKAHSLAEAAGAAPLAAAFQLREELKGKNVGLICSGGNATPAEVQRAFKSAGLSLRS
ncbi:MAG TPA: threonine/serine dehydratase [Pyrinomonadaceae bacterium]|jgi:threonine dehydratase|nr:threonine/serine dehydratase [Pyrinomonadaceae bacterium]